MIIVKISDGLGNQLFQYAVGRMLSIERNTALKLDLSWFREKEVRPFLLPNFNAVWTEATNDEIQEVKATCFFKEKQFHFQPEIFDLPDHVYLEGYWQSERYFRTIASVLDRDFVLKTNPSLANRMMMRRICDSESVALHIRRGDYVHHPETQKIHGTCSNGYYQQALQYLCHKVKEPHLFIFSDDWEWAARNLHIDLPSIVVALNLPERCWEDLRLMSKCRYHIIANSTFSWWGAWLGRSSSQVVMAPRKWFNQSRFDTRDLYLEDWTLVGD